MKEEIRIVWNDHTLPKKTMECTLVATEANGIIVHSAGSKLFVPNTSYRYYMYIQKI